MEFSEIVRLSLNAIRANKLRSLLTLLGIVIGVFSIIGVMTAVQVLQNGIESGLSNLGAHTFQIQKFPVMASREEWLKARNRKNIDFQQAEYVESRMTHALYIGIESFENGETVQSLQGEKTNPNVNIFGETPNGIPTNNWTVSEGRAITESDQRSGARVAVIAPDVKNKVFPRGGAIGQEVKIRGIRYTVIGIFESKGAALGGPNDNFVAIPLSTFLNHFGEHRRSLNIMIKAKGPEVYEDAVEEARFLLRTVRKVDPGKEDDFSIFSNDSMIATFNDFTKYVKLGVAFISFISLLAAGVGIMNIMLVSVSERIKEIGVRKAVGARKVNILSQFLTEAIVLCQIGGIIGIIVGILAGNLAAMALELPAVFPYDWAGLAVLICTIIGVVFGVYPAWKAANLDPIESLRYE
jgi:putative ABC transport system permease protein